MLSPLLHRQLTLALENLRKSSFMLLVLLLGIIIQKSFHVFLIVIVPHSLAVLSFFYLESFLCTVVKVLCLVYNISIVMLEFGWINSHIHFILLSAIHNLGRFLLVFAYSVSGPTACLARGKPQRSSCKLFFSKTGLVAWTFAPLLGDQRLIFLKCIQLTYKIS